MGWGAGGCRGRTAGLGGLWAAPPGAVPGGGLRGPAPGGVGGCRCLLLQGGAEELAEGAGQEREEGRLPGFVLPGDTRSSQGAGPGFPPAPPHFCHYLRSDFTLHLLRCLLDQLCFPPCKGDTGFPGTDEQDSFRELRAETPRVLAFGSSQLAPASTRGDYGFRGAPLGHYCQGEWSFLFADKCVGMVFLHNAHLVCSCCFPWQAVRTSPLGSCGIKSGFFVDRCSARSLTIGAFQLCPV